MSRFLSFLFSFLNIISMHANNDQSDTLIVGYTTAAPFIITDKNKPSGIGIWLREKSAKDLELNYELKEMDFTSLLDKLESGEVGISQSLIK